MGTATVSDDIKMLISVVDPDIIKILSITEVSTKVNLWLIWKIISSWKSNIFCTLITMDSEGVVA